MADIERTRLLRGLPVPEDEFYDDRFEELFYMEDPNNELYDGVDIFSESTGELFQAIMGVFPTVNPDGSVELELLDTYEDADTEFDSNAQYPYLRMTVDIANSLGGFTNDPYAEIPLPEVSSPESEEAIDAMRSLAFENRPTGGLVFSGEPDEYGLVEFYYSKGFPREVALSQVLGMAAARLIGHGMDNGESVEL